MNLRLLLLALLFGGASALMAQTPGAEVVASRQRLDVFPLQIEQWQGRRTGDLDQAILAELGVDEYVNAVYAGVDRSLIGLYIGYYGSQRQGDTIHSPANCLPGGGWEPIETGRLMVPVPAAGDPVGSTSTRRAEINRWIIQSGDEQQLVLYWYQSHGRVLASEYWTRFYLAFDAMRLNRTDGALIRIITPITGDSPRAVDEAERRALSFVEDMFPVLDRFLPV
jgi:EpsI family protein